MQADISARMCHHGRMVTKSILAGKQYVLSAPDACTASQTAPNGTSVVVASIPAGGGQISFVSIASNITFSQDSAVLTGPFDKAPTLGSNGGGGYIESNLHIGHGASAAVAAQCVLTPGADLDIAGTLEHDGSVVELEDQFAELDIAVSHPEYGGKLEVADTDGQTLYTFDVPAAPGDFASIVLTLAEGWEMSGIEFALDKGGGDTLELIYDWEGEFVLADFADFLNSGAEGSLGDFAEAQTWGPGIKITLKDPAFAGTAGNAVSYASRVMSPFTNEDGETFSGGGENARDLAGLVEAMQDDDSPVMVEANSGNDGVLLTSNVGGAAGAYNVVNAEGGDLWLGVDDTLAIANPRTLADLASTIEEDLTLMQLASASVSEGKIVLTAPTTPTATEYNNLEYTATGCFGSGTVKQGSTTRGKNAVTKTSWRIYLNGDEFSGGGTPSAPVPEVLGEDTAMKHGGVYTVAAAGTELHYLTVTIADYASAEIWITCTALTTVKWPETWSWVDGIVPPCKAGNRYFVRVWSDGHAVVAELKYSYANA